MIASVNEEAEFELIDGARYYAQEGGPELGFELIAEFERMVELLRSYPRLGAEWRGRRRKLPIRRFPYNVIYYLRGDEIRVVAFAHQRRRPGYWAARK